MVKSVCQEVAWKWQSPFSLSPECYLQVLIMTERISSKTSSPIVAVDEGEVPDQWSGSNDRAERRRRQNRVNQRAFRTLPRCAEFTLWS